MATATNLPSSSFSPTPSANLSPVWNSTAWHYSKTILPWLSDSTTGPPTTFLGRRRFTHASITILTIVFVLGSIGNFLVIWILGFKMKRTVVTLFFLHLSIADFILVLQIPVVIAPIAMDSHWAMGTAACKLHTYAFVVNMNASVYFLTLISLDRYAALLHPVSSLPLRRLRVARWLCLAVWLLALLLSLPPLIFRTTRWTNEGFVACYNSYGEDFDVQARWGTAMKISRFVLSFAVPYAVMIFCYCRIGARLRHVDKARRGNSLRIIVAVVVAFFVCWAPYNSMVLLRAISYVHRDHEMVRVTGTAFPIVKNLMVINSCVNPILYVFSGSRLKTQVRRSLVAAIENAFRELEQDDFGQDLRRGRTMQLRAGANLRTNVVGSNSSGNLEGSGDDETRVMMAQEEHV
ncbi:C3a anaphylatoxin chemotactic receptor-like [Lampetra fluviatilis]